MKFFWRAGHLLQHTVDAEADAKLLFERLEMNVTGTMVVSLEQERRNHFDDRSVARGSAFLDSFGPKHHICGTVRTRFAFCAVEVGYGLLDGVRSGADVFNVAIENEGKSVRRFHVHRVPDRHDERAVA